MKRYHIPDEFWPTLENAPEIEGFSEKYKLVDLLRDSKFYIMPSDYMGGITLHRKAILLHKRFEQFSKMGQLRIIAHEGFHVAQQKAWGWISFMWKYLMEWFKAGFSYEKMKTFGIEKAAYDYERLFAQLFFGGKGEESIPHFAP